MKYMESLPPGVNPKVGSDGAKYRRKQMMYQLPIHDHDENYCDSLTEAEKDSMRQFCDDRNQNALGVGDVREKTNPVSKWVCQCITITTVVLMHSASFLKDYKDCLPHNETKLPVKSIFEPGLESLFWLPTCLPGFECVPWLAC